MRAFVVGMVLLCGITQGAEPKTVTNSIGMKLIEIPAGKFMMGTPEGEEDYDEGEVQVAVTLAKPFGLGKTEVTQGQWRQVMGTEPWNGELEVNADKDCPATWVSLFDAMEFCDALTDLERKAGKLKANEEYRLPTEAEWEYACRAGTTTVYSFGNDKKQLGEYAWCDGDKPDVFPPHKVGVKKPNPWGLHDMHGNVWEWCSDCYDDFDRRRYSEETEEETELAGVEEEEDSGSNRAISRSGCSERVIRGGGWGIIPKGHRSAERMRWDGDMPWHSVGFRVARSQSAQ